MSMKLQGLDIKNLYPNLYAERHKHKKIPTESSSKSLSSGLHVPEHRPSSSCSSNSVRPNSTGSSKEATTADRNEQIPTSRSASKLSKTSASAKINTTGLALQSTSACNSNQLGPSEDRASYIRSLGRPNALSSRERVAKRSSSGIGDHESSNPNSNMRTNLPAHIPRAVVVRGELGFTKPHEDASTSSSTPRLATSSRPSSSVPYGIMGTTPSILVESDVNLESLVLNVRPRSRYARRDNMRQSVRTLERISTAPNLLSPSEACSTQPSETVLSGRDATVISTSKSTPELLTTTANSHPKHLDKSLNAIISWEENDVNSFFLTEVDAKVQVAQRQFARNLARGSFLLYGSGNFEEAIAHFSSALSYAQNNEDISMQTLINHHIGIALKEQRKLHWAFTMQKKALEMARNVLHDRMMEGRILKALGVVLLEVQEYEKALDHEQEALNIAISEKAKDLEARVYANLGNIASSKMQFGHALACYERDLKLSMQLHSAVGQARAHQNLSLVYGKLHKKDLAMHHEQQAAAWAGPRAFTADVKSHPNDCVGNICMQLTKVDTKIVELVASCLTDVINEQKQVQEKSNSTELATQEDPQELSVAPIRQSTSAGTITSRRKSTHK